MLSSPLFAAARPGLVVPAGPAVQAAALHSWRTAHALLAAHQAAGLAPAQLADFAVYYHCVYQAFGCSEHGALAQQLAEQLAQLPWPGPGRPWAAAQVDQASALAWLSAQRAAAGLPAACPPAQLAALDEALYQEVQGLHTPPAARRRGLLVRVARYLRLRLPVPTAAPYLHALLAHWPAVPAPATAEQPLRLGLADGLAAELLVLIRAQQAGVAAPGLAARVAQGLRHLLALKRDVDFLEQQYAVFPDQVHTLAPEGTFSAELSWRCGDGGQSWLLYEAQTILHDPELANMAELLGLNTLLRTSIPATGVVGPGFYQGAAGVAELYAQLYRRSGQPAYRRAYHHWLGRTQELLVPALATAAPLAATPGEAAPLGGLLGTALVLLTAAKETTPQWQAILV